MPLRVSITGNSKASTQGVFRGSAYLINGKLRCFTLPSASALSSGDEAPPANRQLVE